MNTRYLLLILILFATDAIAEESMEQIVNKPVVVSVAGMDAVRIEKDLGYTQTDNPRLRMDVYIPANAKRSPVVLFVHGGVPGNLTPKNWGVYVSWGKLVAASGMVGVTFTHRLGYPNPHLKDAWADVQAAMDYIRANAEKFHADPDRMCIAAYSAGGPLLSPFIENAPKGIRCLVAYYTFLDIQQTPEHSKYEDAESVRAFSPIVQMSEHAATMPPMLILRGGADQIPTLKDSIDRFLAAALANDAPVEFMNNPGAPHAFDNQTNTPRTREIILRSIDFMKNHLDIK